MQQVSDLNRDLKLDALRSIAILYIIGFWHLCGYSESLSNFTNSNMAYIMKCCVLGLFSFLSGLLMSKRYYLHNIQNVLQFYKRRFIRIYPLYIVFLSGFLLTNRIDISTYISSVLLINMFIPIHLLTLWFVTMILLFNMITPLFLYKYNNIKTILFSLTILLILIVIHLTTRIIDSKLYIYFVPFTIGILVGRNEGFYAVLQRKYAICIGIILLLGTYNLLSKFNQEILEMIIIDVAILAAIPVFYAIGHMLIRLLPVSLISFCSISSFMAYLIHRYTFALGIRFYKPTGILSSVAYLGFFILPVTFIVAYIIQDAYDGLLQFRVFNRLRKYYKN